MGRKKLQKFAELGQLSNVSELNQPNVKKKLQNFLSKKKIILELACGKGDYSLALAKEYPDINFIGIDIQGERLWHGANRALAERLTNIYFLRIQIENLAEYFDKNSINEIWITFPDPFPKKGHIKKRLTSTRFLKIYQTILKPNGIVHLKTDDDNLFAYSIESVEEYNGKILQKISNIYKQPHDKLLDIQTEYEKRHLKAKKTINYLKFLLPN